MLGHSWGGGIAMLTTAQDQDAVNRLVLVDAAGLWLDEAPAQDFFARLQDAPALRRMMLHDPGSFLGDLLFPADPDEERIEAGLRAMQAIARIGWNPFLHSPKLRSRLRRITSPTLVLWGRNDAVFSNHYAQAFGDAIPGSTVHLIDRCGHLPMFEQEAKFVSNVTRFLRSA
jgi:pimeloyl-ACP methyl ester carboxylesterase